MQVMKQVNKQINEKKKHISSQINKNTFSGIIQSQRFSIFCLVLGKE